jgi:hypothetical protein
VDFEFRSYEAGLQVIRTISQQLNELREVRRYDTNFSTRCKYPVTLLQHCEAVFPGNMLDYVFGKNILEGSVREWISASGIEINLVVGRFDVCIQPTRRVGTSSPEL